MKPMTLVISTKTLSESALTLDEMLAGVLPLIFKGDSYRVKGLVYDSYEGRYRKIQSIEDACRWAVRHSCFKNIFFESMSFSSFACLFRFSSDRLSFEFSNIEIDEVFIQSFYGKEINAAMEELRSSKLITRVRCVFESTQA